MGNWIKKNLSNLILILMFLVGLSLLLYPTISDHWNSTHQSQAIASYTKQVETLESVDYQKMLEEARAYNENLMKKADRWVPSEVQKAEYNRTLDVSGNGVMGYVEIPCISVSMPIYHGVDESVLQVAIGHLEGTSLPVGGEGTHCAISGHRGLPSAKLFTDLDQLRDGDRFRIGVLEEVLTYEVDQIRIVEPSDLTELEIVEGEDYCTLITCTPYGINSHRLMVRGHRVATEEEKIVIVAADAVQIDEILVATCIAIPTLCMLLLLVLVFGKKR